MDEYIKPLLLGMGTCLCFALLVWITQYNKKSFLDELSKYASKDTLNDEIVIEIIKKYQLKHSVAVKYLREFMLSQLLNCETPEEQDKIKSLFKNYQHYYVFSFLPEIIADKIHIMKADKAYNQELLYQLSLGIYTLYRKERWYKISTVILTIVSLILTIIGLWLAFKKPI